MDYQTVLPSLRRAYNQSASYRDTNEIVGWKHTERQQFLDFLKQEGKQRLLEIGAGPGRYGKWFQDNGLQVVCTDLSPEMVSLCREKGLEAYEMDFLNLDFPAGSFDAVFALNCLLHVPLVDKPTVLENVYRLLRPGGLFYLGMYGGHEFEGIWQDDNHNPKRFFCYHTEEHIQELVTQQFEIVDFHTVEVGRPGELNFQSLTLRTPSRDSHL